MKNIEEDKLVEISLDESIPLINADNAWALGYDGTGQTVAVLDTGIRSDHIVFDSRVVEEACYSGYSPASTSLCPNGSTSQIGPGAADATTANCYVGLSNICWHGTFVAGIMAGDHTEYSGVAPKANIIAIQVFSRTVDGGQIRISAYTKFTT